MEQSDEGKLAYLEIERIINKIDKNFIDVINPLATERALSTTIDYIRYKAAAIAHEIVDVQPEEFGKDICTDYQNLAYNIFAINSKEPIEGKDELLFKIDALHDLFHAELGDLMVSII